MFSSVSYWRPSDTFTTKSSTLRKWELTGSNSNSRLLLLIQVFCHQPGGRQQPSPSELLWGLSLTPLWRLCCLPKLRCPCGQWDTRAVSRSPAKITLGARPLHPCAPLSHAERSLQPFEHKALEGLGLLKATSGLSNMHTNNIITAEWFGERVYFVVVPITF